jgi:hypothetical protein
MREDKILSFFLWLVAIHSFLVGAGLVVLPTSAFEYFGFNPTFERFFSTQGGVFHIAMSVGYAMAGYNKIKYKQLIVFSIIVKFIATVFLISYFLIISPQWLILMSGISDFLMGVVILYLYLVLNRNLYFDKTQL